MTTQFPQIGAEFTAGNEDDFNNLFDCVHWKDVPCTLPMMQSLGIKGMVNQLCLPPPIRVGDISGGPLPESNGLLAVEIKTDKQHFQVFALDDGVSLTPLAMRNL